MFLIFVNNTCGSQQDNWNTTYTQSRVKNRKKKLVGEKYWQKD